MSNLKFYGMDTVELAKEYGTPLYVMSEDHMIERINAIKESFDDKHPNCRTHFAAKSYMTKDMVRLCMELNIGIDCVSAGELYAVKLLGFPMDKVTMHGNAKTLDEIKMAIEYEVGHFVCDSIGEIEIIDRVAKEQGKKVTVLIRVTPGVDSHTHSYIQTAMVDSKFGVPFSEMMTAVKTCMGMKNIELTGFHFHVGSQLLENDSHLMAIKIILGLMKQAKEELGFVTKDFDLGGGYGIHYTNDDNVKPIAYFLDPMVGSIKDFCAENGLEMPYLYIEPGRFIVGEAGITLYTVTSIKTIPDIRTYVGIDGGIPDNIRPALYQAIYEAEVANKEGEPKTDVVTIAGKCCESGDIIIRDLSVPNVEVGDIIAVKSTGAYNYTMASNYNKCAIPAVVAIRDGKSRISVKRQTLAEMFERDL